MQARPLARKLVQESLVLLKNDANTLPLARGKKVLVVGKSADSMTDQTGGWTLTWQGTGNSNKDFPHGDTILAGLRDALGESNVSFSIDGAGVDLSKFDAVVAVIGEHPYAEGDGDIGPAGNLRHSAASRRI
jgi:beta-glucosidase